MPMFAYITPPLKKITNSAKKNSMMDKFLSFSVKINLKNDTDKDLQVSPTAIFVIDYSIVTIRGIQLTLKKTIRQILSFQIYL
ncbi:hypothetical protein DM558_07025 [Entomomonas moraniae]|uniref:DUF7424 domain-containing protein n=1 Tax=Entomomonas moraniae TaxID=2213226 RepID=A0A3Q9JM98_9GAMM|nr:hypothetical protein [Entomomonas moraniae]AZS50545.1 hypothetical protein DM558_07025 [Entomomonas moraniae]